MAGRKRLKRQDRFDPEEMRQAMIEHGGIIKKVAEVMQCTRGTVYEYMGLYPEIAEAQQAGEDQLDRAVVETAYDKLDIWLDHEDPMVAFKSAQLALTKSKKSRYYTAPPSMQQGPTAATPVELKEMSAQLRDLKRENELLKAKAEKRLNRPRKTT